MKKMKQASWVAEQVSAHVGGLAVGVVTVPACRGEERGLAVQGGLGSDGVPATVPLPSRAMALGLGSGTGCGAGSVRHFLRWVVGHLGCGGVAR